MLISIASSSLSHPPQRKVIRAHLHVCAHLCTLAILQSARSLLDSHNYQSSQNPTSNFLLLLQHQNMANWNFDNIPKHQFGSFPPQEDNQAMSTPVHYSACDLVQLKSGKCQKLDLFKMIRCTILTFAQLNHLFRVMDFVRLDYFTTLPSNNSENIMTGAQNEKI